MSSVHLPFKVRFDGLDADRNMLEAYPAAHSLEGLTWALALTMHFAMTGEVRNRGNLTRSVKIYISPPRRGSFINDLNVFVAENPFLVATVGAYTVNSVTPYINGVVKYVFNKAIGASATLPQEAQRLVGRLDEGNLERIVERIEPPLTRAHKVIGKTSETISFKSHRTELALLDKRSKAYLASRLNEEFETFDTNVTSFNILTGNGRLFDPATNETSAFSLGSNSRHGTATSLIKSMEHYVSGHKGTIRIVAQRIETADQLLKKFIVSSAEEIPSNDWIDGVDPLRTAR